MRVKRTLTFISLLLCIGRLVAYADECAVCGGPFGTVVYLVQDKVTEEKKQVCYNCTMLSERCFTCGLPVATKESQMPDGRVLCARDARNAVIEDEDGARVWRETKDSLDRLLSRFLAFPQTNISFTMVDRVRLQQLFKFAGHDYDCPNVWGCIESSNGHGQFEHAISLLSALPRDSFKSTCAHEYAHAWLNENLGEKRRQTLNSDAIEGFCELVAYMLMDAQREEAQKKLILLNSYTRGQVHLFVEAEKRFGFDDVVDWMKSGSDDRLLAEDLGRVRQIENLSPPGAALTLVPIYKTAPAPAPDVLMLKGIVWNKERSTALINDRSFKPGEEGLVRVGKTNVTVRCLNIRQDSVRIRLAGSGEEKELRLKEAPPAAPAPVRR